MAPPKGQSTTEHECYKFRFRFSNDRTPPTDMRPLRTSTSSSNASLSSLPTDEAVRPTKCWSRHCRVLENNRTLLTNNIVWSADFHQRLAELCIIPLSMLREVKANSKRVDRNAALVAHLQRLGPKHFKKFCDLLHFTGHVFLADHLREEASQKGNTGVSYDDIIRKLPALQNPLSLFEQHQLAEHIKDRVNEAMTKNVWRAQTDAKSRLSQQRQRLLDDDIDRARTLRDKDAQIERLREILAEANQSNEQQKATISGLEKDQRSVKGRNANEIQKLTRAYQATERCNARESNRVSMFDTQVKSLNARIAKHLGVTDAASSNTAVYLGSDNVKMSRLEDNVTRLLSRLDALQALTGTASQQGSDERVELLDSMQIPRSTANAKLACNRTMAKIYASIQGLQKEVDKITSELGIGESSEPNYRWNNVACDKPIERIHVAITAVKNDLVRAYRRITETSLDIKAPVKRNKKISVTSIGSNSGISPLSPKTPLASPSPRWPLQQSKQNLLPPVRISRQISIEPEKRRFFGDDWNRTLQQQVSIAKDIARQKGGQRKKATFVAS